MKSFWILPVLLVLTIGIADNVYGETQSYKFDTIPFSEYDLIATIDASNMDEDSHYGITANGKVILEGRPLFEGKRDIQPNFLTAENYVIIIVETYGISIDVKRIELEKRFNEEEQRKIFPEFQLPEASLMDVGLKNQITELKQENTDLKLKITELENNDLLLELQIQDLKDQLDSAHQVILTQLKVIADMLEKLKLSN